MQTQYALYNGKSGALRIVYMPAREKNGERRIYAAAASLAPLDGQLNDAAAELLTISVLVFFLGASFVHIASRLHFKFAEEMLSFPRR